MEIRAEMERIEAHKLQPHFIEEFFIEAFTRLGGKLHKRERGRYEITYVPGKIRNRDMQIGFGESVLTKYERICFDKADCNIPGLAPAALICPGHPLLEATSDLIREQYRSVMKQGAVFIDENDFSTDARLLFYIEDCIQDGVVLPNGSKRVISKNVHFVELKEDGTAINAGYAPYLDYRAVAESEIKPLRDYISTQDWLTQNIEETAKRYAISEIIPRHFSQVREHRQKMCDKIAKAVKSRLTAEIQYWDFKAADLKEKENAGKVNAKLNSDNAHRKAEELEARMNRRLAEIEKEKAVSAAPPIIVGGALVIPKGLLHKFTNTGAPDMFGSGDRKAVELAAMKAVTDIERSLGFIPKDVSAENVGYDIESVIPEDKRNCTESSIRFIEVKGRTKSADTVTVTKK